MDFEEQRRRTIIKLRRALNRMGIREKKVFAIGFNKAGTSSLHALFEELGRPSYHGTQWRSFKNTEILQEYDCFSDGIPDDFQKLDRTFPASKFILQLRALDTWIYSRLAHIDKEKERGAHTATDYWDSTDSAVRFWIVQRNEYHLAVLEYFANRPNDLLVINFIRDAEAATKVCRFLGYKGTYERPEKNVNSVKAPPSHYVKMLQRCTQELGLPQEELAYDIYCPSLVTASALLRYPKNSIELLQPF
jgi:hypothetical protein